jgi:hypothetical protein
MGKGHRDNHAARVKRGDSAFAKKRKRRAAVRKRTRAKCPIHGGFDCTPNDCGYVGS